MNLEKIIFVSIIGFVLAGVYLGVNRPSAHDLDNRQISPEANLVPDFDLKEVLDNTPFKQYYVADKRNPFVPCEAKPVAKVISNPGDVKPVDSNFPVIKDRPKPKPKPKPVEVKPKVKTVYIPAKPAPEDDLPAEKVDAAAAQKDDTIPVYLIGFAKTFTEATPDRKAILANKKTGEVYTVQKGDQLKQFGLTIAKITPFSIIIRMKNGRKVEFLNDVLKE